MRWLVLLLLLALGGLQYALWLGPHGIPRRNALVDAVAAERQRHAALVERNERLAAEVRDLREGLEAVEERARNDIGLIRDGEVFVQIVAPPPPADPTR